MVSTRGHEGCQAVRFLLVIGKLCVELLHYFSGCTIDSPMDMNITEYHWRYCTSRSMTMSLPLRFLLVFLYDYLSLSSDWSSSFLKC